MSSAKACSACSKKRKPCQDNCVLAPYFPANNADKFKEFTILKEYYGEANLRTILKELSPCDRQDALSSLLFEASMRNEEPVYGIAGLIYLLQRKKKKAQDELDNTLLELAALVGADAMVPNLREAFIQPYETLGEMQEEQQVQQLEPQPQMHSQKHNRDGGIEEDNRDGGSEEDWNAAELGLFLSDII